MLSNAISLRSLLKSSCKSWTKLKAEHHRWENKTTVKLVNMLEFIVQISDSVANLRIPLNNILLVETKAPMKICNF